MLKKLLKYDLKYMVKNMSLFYLLSIFFAITSRILLSLNQTVIISIISKISVGCMFAMIANTFINTIMRSWIRFRDSLYKDEAYLTHTLPVSKEDIYNSKFIQTLIFFVIGCLVIIISLLITYYSKSRWLLFKGLLTKVVTGFNLNITLFIISFLLIIFLEVFNTIVCGFLGIILGYQRNNNKTIFSVAFGLAGYLISQSLILLLIYITGLFNKNIMILFQNDNLINPESLKILSIISIIFYIFIIGIISFLCKRELNKGVNIE